MGDGPDDERLIRSYLLGELSAEELEAVEERLMTDSQFAELALVVESVLVEDYVEGELSGRARKSFEQLFLSTPQGSESIRFAHELKEYASRAGASEPAAKAHWSAWRSAFGAPRWALAAAAIFLIIAGTVVWRVITSKSETEKGLTALGRAYQEQPIDARITGLDYAPRVSLRGDAAHRANDASLRQAEITLTNEARANPGYESFHAVGRFYLTQRDFTQAIDYFEKAIDFRSDVAEIHSDLGAALLELGKALERDDPGKGAEAFSRSREHLSNALALDQGLLEARFNSALLYQQVGLFPEALDEWREYLKRDASSRWAGEARKNIGEIEDRNR
jgi:tetratricopeptide (TPR) repeat protein